MSHRSLLILPALLLFCSCNQWQKEQIVSHSVNSISFCISDFQIQEENASTRTAIGSDGSFFWAAGDTVGIYPNTGGQVYFELADGAGASSAKFDGGGWDFKSSAVYYSYYPFIGDIYLDRTHIPVSYLGQKQIGTDKTDHIGPYDYMYTPGSSAENGNVSFTYNHLSCIIKLRLQLPVGTYSKLAITAPSNVLPVKGYFNLMADSPAIIPTEYSNQLSIDLEDFVVTDSSTDYYVWLLSAPVNLNGVEVTVSVLNGNKTELQCKKTPSREYLRENIYPLGCVSWTEVPQSMNMIIIDWEDGGNIIGDAE